MESGSKKINFLAFLTFGLGVLPFFYVDFKYLFRLGISQKESAMIILGLLIWLACIIFFIVIPLLKRKPDALFSVLAILYASMVLFLKQILLFGFYGKNADILLSVIVYILIFILIKNKAVRDSFPLTEKNFKSERLIDSIGLISIIGMLALYYIVVTPRIKHHPEIIQNPVGMTITKSLETIPETVEQKAFGWTLPIPKILPIRKDHKADEKDVEDSVWFRKSDSVTSIIVNKSHPLFSNEWSNLARFIKIESDYEFAKKVYYEKTGLIFLVIKTLLMAKNPMTFDIKTNELKGFLNKVIDTKEDIIFYEYLLFDDKDNQIDVSFLIKNNQMTENQVKEIIAHLNFVGN